MRGGGVARLAPPASVLVVDDDLILGRSLCRAFGAAGFTTTAVESGLEAEAFIARSPVEAVVTDLCMPGLGGLGLLRSIRAQDRDLPVVVITGSSSASLSEAVTKEGGTLCLSKPLDGPDLVRRVATEVLKRRARRTETLASEHLGVFESPSGNRYSLHFIGGSTPAAVAFGPLPRAYDRVAAVSEAHREPASDVDDARCKLAAWQRRLTC